MNHSQPSTPAKPITMNTVTKKIDVDNHISLGNYYGIADNLLKQKLLDVLEELESLKPECQRRVNELNKAYTETQQQQFDGCKEKTSDGLKASVASPSENAPSLEKKPVQGKTSSKQSF